MQYKLYEANRLHIATDIQVTYGRLVVTEHVEIVLCNLYYDGVSHVEICVEVCTPVPADVHLSVYFTGK